MIITIFEDNYTDDLFPFSLTHATFELRCGAFSNLKRIKNLITKNDQIHLIVRKEIVDLIKERYPNYIVNPDFIHPGILINGSTIWDSKKLNKIRNEKIYSKNKKLVGIHLNKKISIKEFEALLTLKYANHHQINIPHFDFIWDGLFYQKNVIKNDKLNFDGMHEGDYHSSVIFKNKNEIIICKNSKILAGCVLDATEGPIIIGKNVTIDIGALIKGPAYIGDYSIINPGAKLRGNISFGPMCKVGGEVEDTIILGYSNKQHDGYLGHSYLGEWINLGANTNNSDLKNNYSNINILLNGQTIETKRQFLGVMIGDYTRTAISTMLNTGTVIGVCANVFGSGFQKKNIKSFAWGKKDKTDLEKLFETIKIIKARREKIFSKAEKAQLTKIYNNNINN